MGKTLDSRYYSCVILTSVINSLSKSQSKNVSIANNQQERLIGWITGFVDGEGCFSVGFVKQSNKKEENRLRKGYKTGYQVSHEFAVTQGESSLESLRLLKKYFQVGQLIINRRYDNHKEHLYRYVVRRRSELKEVIIPFFKKYGLRTAKKKDFKMFKKCVDLMEKGEHLTHSGIIKIAQITEQMNRKKSRSKLIRILRDHTPN